MINQSISDGLKPYAIGEKIRTLRLRRNMGLVELGRHTGLSAALLSKLERGKLFPTLPTLMRVAMVFSVGLEYFFTDEHKQRVVAVARKQDRVRLPERPGATEVSYFFESLDYPAPERKMNAFLAEFQELAPEKNKPHQHSGIEFVYVLSGTLGLRIASDFFELEEGDSIYFDSTVQHAYRKLSKKACMAVVITLP